MARKNKKKVQKRLYYKIGEACKLVDIQPYVLRYWETEFPSLSPDKSKSGQRVYSEKEIDIIRRIKHLLYDEGYTIAGAKKKLSTELEAGELGEGAKQAGGGKSGKGKQTKGKKASGGKVDSGADKRVEQLRNGIEQALGEAREILSLLDAHS